MAQLLKPERNELIYRRKLLGSRNTMAFAGGTVPFPKEEWQTFYDTWVDTDPKDSFYGFVYCGGCMDFVGSARYAKNAETGEYESFILIHASHRNSGYGRWAVKLLKEKARENGIDALHAHVRRSWNCSGFLEKTGFTETGSDEDTIHYVLDTRN